MAGEASRVSTNSNHFGTISGNKGVVFGQASGDVQVVGFQTNNYESTQRVQLNFFKTSNYESFKNFNPEPAPETCAWFFEHSKFHAWNANNSADLLWLSADPGCGKSVLSRALIDHKLAGSENSVICYFFLKDNEDQNGITTTLCALLHQLFYAHKHLLPEYAEPAVNKCGDALRNDFEELWRLLISAATDPSAGDVICILDALDECPPLDRNKLIAALESFYDDALRNSKSGCKIKFLVTSRPYTDIKNKFRKLTRQIPTIWLNGEEELANITREIGHVMDVELKEIAEDRELDNEVLSALHERLSATSNRTYLWLHIVLKEVRETIDYKKMKLLEIIDTLPKSVEEAYEKILAKCNGKEAKRALQIIVAAQRPLTLSEIEIALEIDDVLKTEIPTSYQMLDIGSDMKRQEWLRNVCGLFVSIVDSRVYLIHQTAREFLIREENKFVNTKGWRHSINLQNAHTKLSRICISYLLFKEFQKDQLSPLFSGPLREHEERSITLCHVDENAFLDYAAKYWTIHVEEGNSYAIKAADPGSHNTWTMRAAKLFVFDDELSYLWLCVRSPGAYQKWYKLRGRTLTPSLPFFWSAFVGLTNVTELLLHLNMNQHHGDSSTLQTALSMSREETMSLSLVSLRTAGAPSNVYGDALEDACRIGSVTAVKILLKYFPRSIDPSDSAIIMERAAEIAAMCLHEPAIMELLLVDGRTFSITEAVVKDAARNQKYGKDILQLFVERGKEFKITAETLEAAARNTSCGKEILQLLLVERGKDIKVTTKIAAASTEGGRLNKDVLELLLQERRSEFMITKDMLKEIISRWSTSGKVILELLLRVPGHEINLAEEIVEIAGENQVHSDFFLFLAETWPDIMHDPLCAMERRRHQKVTPNLSRYLKNMRWKYYKRDATDISQTPMKYPYWLRVELSHDQSA